MQWFKSLALEQMFLLNLMIVTYWLNINIDLSWDSSPVKTIPFPCFAIIISLIRAWNKCEFVLEPTMVTSQYAYDTFMVIMIKIVMISIATFFCAIPWSLGLSKSAFFLFENFRPWKQKESDQNKIRRDKNEKLSHTFIVFVVGWLHMFWNWNIKIKVLFYQLYTHPIASHFWTFDGYSSLVPKEVLRDENHHKHSSEVRKWNQSDVHAVNQTIR